MKILFLLILMSSMSYASPVEEVVDPEIEAYMSNFKKLSRKQQVAELNRMQAALYKAAVMLKDFKPFPADGITCILHDRRTFLQRGWSKVIPDNESQRLNSEQIELLESYRKTQ